MTISNLMKMKENSPKGRKHWEKDKLLIMNNFSFKKDLYCRNVKTRAQLGKG